MPFLWALGLTAATVLIHAFGTLAAITHLSPAWRRPKNKDRGPFAAVFQIIRVVAALLLLHFLEAGTWAALYSAAGLLPDPTIAFYFSLTSYTTVGYGDVVLPDSWRVLGPIEAAVGILMFGWSTAVMVTAVTRVYQSRLHPEAAAQSDEQHS